MAAVRQARAIGDSGLTASSTTSLLALVQAPLAGSCLVLAIQARSTTAVPTITSVTDDQGNVWAKAVNPATGNPVTTSFGTAQGLHEWWICPKAKGGETLLSITAGAVAGARRSGQFWEITGSHPTAPIDRVSQSTGNSGTAATGPTAAVATPAEPVLAMTGGNIDAATALAAASGYTMHAQQGHSSTAPQFASRAGYRVGVAAGETFSWSTVIGAGATNYLWAATIITFRSATVAALGRATTTGTARPLGRRRSRALGRATTLAAARTVTRRRVRALGQASTTATARPLGRRRVRALGRAQTIAAAQALGRIRRRALNRATTAAIAGPINRAHRRALGQAISASTARAVGRRRRRALGRAMDASLARTVRRARRRVLGRALETAVARIVTAAHSRRLGTATETSTARPTGRARVRPLGQAIGRDRARAIVLLPPGHIDTPDDAGHAEAPAPGHVSPAPAGGATYAAVGHVEPTGPGHILRP